jgi:Tfp pilus assembly protein PilN
MRAVNLIPAEDRRGPGGASKSGGAVYAVLGTLALLVVLTAAWALAGKSVTDKQAQLTRVEHDASAAEAQGAGLSDYSSFASLRERRVQTVTSIAGSRFDWSHAMHELGRVLPSNVWLTSMTGTVTSTTAVDGGTQNGLRSSLPGPAIDLVGCTTSQDEVARVVTRLRLIDGVIRVALASSAKADTTSAASSNGGGDCRAGSSNFPQFEVVVFFETPPAASASAPAAPATPATAAPASGSAAPASGSTAAAPGSATSSTAQTASSTGAAR